MNKHNLSGALLAFTLIFPNIRGEEPPNWSPAEIRTMVAEAMKTRGEVKFWRSDELGLTFSYDERWEKANPSRKDTVAVYNWRTASGSVMATVFVSAYDSEVASVSFKQLQENGKEIVQRIIKNESLRDPNIKLLGWRAARQDGYPVLVFERVTRMENINRSIETKLITIFTVWKGKEIAMTGGSEIPMKYPAIAEIAEKPIAQVMGSLQFLRREVKR